MRFLSSSRSRAGDERPACSSVAQRQSIRLLTGGLLVRIQPEEPTSFHEVGHLGLSSGIRATRRRVATRHESSPRSQLPEQISARALSDAPIVTWTVTSPARDACAASAALQESACSAPARRPLGSTPAAGCGCRSSSSRAPRVPPAPESPSRAGPSRPRCAPLHHGPWPVAIRAQEVVDVVREVAHPVGEKI